MTIDEALALLVRLELKCRRKRSMPKSALIRLDEIDALRRLLSAIRT